VTNNKKKEKRTPKMNKDAEREGEMKRG